MSKKILIVGAGIAGLTLMNCLKNTKYIVELVEQDTQLRTDGAGILLGANLFDIFKKMDLDKELLLKSQILDNIISVDNKGNIIGSIYLKKIYKERKLYTVAIHREELHNILSKNIDRESIRLGYKVISIKKNIDQYDVEFENGERATFDKIIATDGIFSTIKEEVFGNIKLRDSNQGCWRFVIDTPKKIDKKSSCEMWGDEKRIGIFPLGYNKTYCFLVSTIQGDEEKLSFNEVLERFNDFGGDWNYVKNSFDVSSTELLYNRLSDAQNVTLEKDGIVFIGDSGHSTTPNLGQGAGIAIESAYEFCELLKTYSYDEACQKYSINRFKKVNTIRERSFKIGQLAHIKSRLLQKIRNFILKILPQKLSQYEFEKLIFS